MIYIKELLADPVGKDTDGEWIMLLSGENEPLVLNGWKLKDESGKTFILDGKKIMPLGELKLTWSETKISLNNASDTITLYDAADKKVDELSYEGASEGETITHTRFKSEAAVKPQLTADLNQLDSKALVVNGYEWWPLFLGVLLGLAAGIVVGKVYRGTCEKP